jgi:ketosteroid isomerase-like protein
MSDATNSLVEVRDVVQRIYKAFEDLDAEKLDQNFDHSSELLAFGTDWDEKFVGWDSYKNVHTIQFKALKKFKFTSKELDIHVKGDIAWIADRPQWQIETKEGQKIENDVRITAVLKRDNANGNNNHRWRVVQWHVSVGLGTRLHEY